MARNKHPEQTVELILDVSLQLFVEKGYVNTSIQDIINNLNGLTKGAIYYHFKSKEEIFEAVCNKLGRDSALYYAEIRDDKNLNGYEKLKKIITSIPDAPNSKVIIPMIEDIMSDPKFLSNNILELYNYSVPEFVQPIIEEGAQDGSIKTAYPKELAEVIMTLLNIWVMACISNVTLEETKNKIRFLSQLLNGIGIDILDEKTLNLLYKYYEKYYN